MITDIFKNVTDVVKATSDFQTAKVMVKSRIFILFIEPFVLQNVNVSLLEPKTTPHVAAPENARANQDM